ncbi:MAG: hypothetical protein IPI54_14130 [Chitinophagaceae bacterium]|nr:hypothetical protein [Chitinophagaceae bacterium]
MNKSRKIYSVSQLISAVIMIMALMWLTVSTPFVYACQQELAKQQKMEKAGSPVAGSEEETNKIPNNNTEEKTPGNTSLSEEYLHNNHKGDYSFAISLQYQKCDNSGTYIAYHGELLVPPPNVL